MSTNRGPNPLSVAWAILRAKRVARPAPGGQSSADHTDLKALLEILKDEGIARLPSLRGEITDYRNFLATVDPDNMSRDGALAFWLNLYNAGALDLAAEAVASRKGSVLRVPGAFTREWATIAGEALSLTEIEHGKIRRFGDPRIHGALVCGSASCPSLRFEPYEAAIVGEQLDDQLRFFFASGGASIDRSKDQLLLSRILLWYGGDFTRPKRMPTWLPPGRAALTAAIGTWLDPDVRRWVDATKPKIVFRPYNWELACAVA